LSTIFVTQEVGKIPSGVYTVISELYENWDYQKFLFSNKLHWIAKEQNVESLSLYLPSELSYLTSKLKNKVLVFLLKGLIKILLLPYSIILIIFLVYVLKKRGIKTIYSHNGGWPGGELNRLTIIAGKLANIKNNILIIHNTPKKVPLYKITINFLLEKLIQYCATDIVTVSVACRESIEDNTALKNLKVIYNGVSDCKSASNKKNNILNKNEVYRIAFIGEIDRRKGLHTMLKALTRIEENFEALIIGNGNDKNYLDQLKKLSRHDKRIKFLGFIDDLTSFYKKIDLLILPSESFESFGMTIIEAMKFKIPVICSDFGGMKEVISNYETGLIFESGNSKDLEEKIRLLVNNNELSRSYGIAGRKRYLDKFSLKNMLDGYMSLLISQS